MPKIFEAKNLKIINWILIIATVLCAIFVGSRVVDDIMRIPGVRGILAPLGVGTGAGLSVVNIIFIVIITLIAIWIAYTILKMIISAAYEKNYLTHAEILFIYLVSSLVAIAVGVFSGFAGDYRVMVTTIVYLIVLFILVNLFLKWKKGTSKRININLAIYGIVLIVIALPMVRNLIFSA